ncbi:MAG: HAD-IC family P-type ATPase, partial [Planctomycetota bacterium]|nr:HAD-IC family P-type ATPase [Planctomycetota bacterium]
TVIFTDKTGTLTENRLSLARVGLADGDYRPADAPARRALEIGMLCNNAELPASGDPLEVALLEAGVAAGIDRAELLRRYPEQREEAFDPAMRMMATVHDGIVAVKGATEAVLDVCTGLSAADKALWLRRADAMAAEGLRVLAVASKEREGGGVYGGLAMIGLLAMLDPPRDDVSESVAACRRAGIRVVMVTGDQAATARTIARATGIVDEPDARVVEGKDLAATADGESVRVYARVSPEQKLDLLARNQAAGEVAAMTGDGVNDAPALKKADIGIAMGRRGTQVAREAADMVLKDDAFSSIVVAVREGRVIFRNIRKFVVYLLSCNLSEILIVTGAALVQAPLPLLPLQILFLNLVTDVFPALALAYGESDESVMKRPPRPPSEAVLTAVHWRALIGYSVVISLSVMAALYVAVEVFLLSGTAATTISFLTLALAQLVHVFNMRDPHETRNDVAGNPWVWGALALCVVLLVVAVYVPGLARVLRLTPPSAREWMLVLGMGTVPLIVGQLVAVARARRAR